MFFKKKYVQVILIKTIMIIEKPLNIHTEAYVFKFCTKTNNYYRPSTFKKKKQY